MSVAATAKVGSRSTTENSQPGNQDLGIDTRWRPVLKLPCQLAVELTMPNFKVGDFVKLQPGVVISTGWRLSRNVPLRVNGTLIGWGEFEGAGKHLAVRVTELA